LEDLMNGREPFPELELRAVDASDVDGVVASFHRMSDRSLYHRFHTGTSDPTPLVHAHLGLVDGRDHGALAVLDDGQIVAVAQWDRDREHAEQAEISISVEDRWQHRGLGRALVRATAGDARRHGVEVLTARVLAENGAARVLASHQQPAATAFDGAETEFRFELAS
jgi:GNAT superfamily N-acetyltransferase